MSNIITLFQEQIVDGTTSTFKISRPDGLGYADTEFSSYIEIFLKTGGIGGGSLSLQKKCGDGEFREVERETLEINANLPSVDKQYIFSMNYKDDSEFRIVLSGSTSPNISIYGINMQLV